MPPSSVGSSCAHCRAVLSPWEKKCACRGPRSRTNREVLYAVACVAPEPLHARDFVRAAERDFNVHLNAATAIAALAGDRRLCWAGKGVYGLYRHGLLPGPRNLEQAARVILVAAGGSLTPEVVDYCLKRLGYRFSPASLRNAVAQSEHIRRRHYGAWDHPRGEDAMRQLRSQVGVVPYGRRAEWIRLRDATAQTIQTAMQERDATLLSLANYSRFGLNWEE